MLMFLVIDNEIVAESESEADLINFANTLDCDFEIVEQKGKLKKSLNFKKL